MSFVHNFYNTRFSYASVFAELIKFSYGNVEIEVFSNEKDIEHLDLELKKRGLCIDDIQITYKTPGDAIINQWAPIWAVDENNNPIGFTFRFLSDHDDYEKIFKKWELFGSWLNTHLGFRQHDLGFDFASAAISVNEDIAFISSDYVEKNKVDILKKFEQIFVNQNFFLVPSLAEEVTSDLDTYILPIAPKTWILPDYPQNSLQYESTKYALNILNDLKHTVHLVPGLHRIKHEDIDAIPNYANSLLINKLAFVPAYALKSDEIIQGILKDYGYKVIPIDCRRIISSSAALHCITKTIPKVI